MSRDFAWPSLVCGAVALAAITIIPLSPAKASTIRDRANNCTTANCEAETFGGAIVAGASFAVPWTVEVFADKNECIRLHVTKQNFDLKMEAISPAGTVWRNDNSNTGSCRNCPVLKFIAPQAGWYNVTVAPANGKAEADFEFAYGRYTPKTNPNCNNPIKPLVNP